VPCMLGSRRREGLRRITGLLPDCLAMRLSFRSAAGSAQGTQLRESDVALFHDIKYGAWSRRDESWTGRSSGRLCAPDEAGRSLRC
jgi:hypothetical protein